MPIANHVQDEIDSNRDGRVSFEEFSAWFSH